MVNSANTSEPEVPRLAPRSKARIGVALLAVGVVLLAWPISANDGGGWHSDFPKVRSSDSCGRAIQAIFTAAVDGADYGPIQDCQGAAMPLVVPGVFSLGAGVIVWWRRNAARSLRQEPDL